MMHLLQLTGDGSHTIESQYFKTTYHSRFGAIQESQVVFIEAGLHCAFSRIHEEQPIRILELGLGTGLNAWLSLCSAEKRQRSISYIALELFPLSLDVVLQLNYAELHAPDYMEAFKKIHQCSWSERIDITDRFRLFKLNMDALCWNPEHGNVDLIYYDAFSPTTQPDLWSEGTLSSFIKTLVPGGVFVTYCAKGEVRRTLQRLGLSVERLPGPPGKREILRGIKLH